MSSEKQNFYLSDESSEEFTFREVLINLKVWVDFIISKWKIIFIGSFFGGIVGFAIAWFDKPIYKATLTFAMEDDKGGGSGGGLSGALGLASSFGIDLGSAAGGGAFAAGNLAELMKSRLIVEKVLLSQIVVNNQPITLAEYYIKINKLRKEWQKNSKLNHIYFLPNDDRSKYNLQQDSILQVIHKDLTSKENLSILQKDKKVTILTIEVKNKNEFFAKVFCESLAKETSDFYIETKSKKARINVNVLQKQVDSVKRELNGDITGVAAEVDNVFNLNPAYNIKGAASKKIQVDVQANTAIITNLVVQLELAKITLRKETPLIQQIDHPILPLEKEKLGKLKTSILVSIFSCIILISYFTIKRLI